MERRSDEGFIEWSAVNNEGERARERRGCALWRDEGFKIECDIRVCVVRKSLVERMIRRERGGGERRRLLRGGACIVAISISAALSVREEGSRRVEEAERIRLEVGEDVWRRITPVQWRRRERGRRRRRARVRGMWTACVRARGRGGGGGRWREENNADCSGYGSLSFSDGRQRRRGRRERREEDTYLDLDILAWEDCAIEEESRESVRVIPLIERRGRVRERKYAKM